MGSPVILLRVGYGSNGNRQLSDVGSRRRRGTGEDVIPGVFAAQLQPRSGYRLARANFLVGKGHRAASAAIYYVRAKHPAEAIIADRRRRCAIVRFVGSRDAARGGQRYNVDRD